MEKKSQQTEENKNQQKIDEPEFKAKVIEVHSGDSLTIFNQQKEERIFLTSIKAPQMGNPKRGDPDQVWAFEAKEFLRKITIGKNVMVKKEYLKKFTNEDQTARTKVFASVFVDEVNIGEKILSEGLAQIQFSKFNDENSLYLPELRKAQEKALDKHLGIYQLQNKIPTKFNDYTLTKSHKNVKNLFQFIANEKQQVVIELVLNGCRFKARILNSNSYIILVLQGLKCLQNDQNFPIYSKYSNKALQYSKQHLLQRDIQVQFNSVDQRGNFFGTIFLNGKNYSHQLISEGLAYTFMTTDQELLKIEKQAQEPKKGIWSEIAPEELHNSQVEELPKPQQMVVSEVTSPTEFYLQYPQSKDLTDLEKELAKFNGTQTEPLALPIKKDTPCLAKWQDGWCRAKVVSEKNTKNNKYLVFFVDFGNYDELTEACLRKSEKWWGAAKPQAQRCAFAYIRPPFMDHQLGEQVATTLSELIYNQMVQTEFVYSERGIKYVIIEHPKKKGYTINEFLLSRGYAKFDKFIQLPSEFAYWHKEADLAMENKLGMWKYADDEEEDF